MNILKFIAKSQKKEENSNIALINDLSKPKKTVRTNGCGKVNAISQERDKILLKLLKNN